jgi:hypothetical protein
MAPSGHRVIALWRHRLIDPSDHPADDCTHITRVLAEAFCLAARSFQVTGRQG